MADKGPGKPAAFSPAFASLMNKANTGAAKPNFGLGDQRPKPNFGLPKFKDKRAESEQKDSSNPGRIVKPIGVGTFNISEEGKQKTTPFANLINRNKEGNTSCGFGSIPIEGGKTGFGSSGLEKLSAKYLSSPVIPKFGSSEYPGVSSGSPVEQRNTQAIQIPQSPARDSGPLSTSASSSDVGSPSSKFTFSPIPNKQSPSQTGTLSSLGKLKDRVKNSKPDNSRLFDGISQSGDSPNFPELMKASLKDLHLTSPVP